MARGVVADDPQAGALAQRWMQMLEQDTGGNPEFAWRMTAMLERKHRRNGSRASRRNSSST
jgi:hypothetical protein